MSYTLTVNIEIGGTRHTGSNGETTPFTAGRVWMSLKNNGRIKNGYYKNYKRA